MTKLYVRSKSQTLSGCNSVKRRREKRRMNELIGSQICRELMPVRKTYNYARNKRKKYQVRYQIKSVFPDKDTMDIAYSSSSNDFLLVENSINK